MKKVTGHLIDEHWELRDEFDQLHFTDGGFPSYQEMCEYCWDNDLELVESFDYDEDEPNPPYIVCWVMKYIDQEDYSEEEFVDEYKAFIDHPSNKYAAQLFYNELVAKEFDQELKITEVWSANLCQVIESTDYTCGS